MNIGKNGFINESVLHDEKIILSLFETISYTFLVPLLINAVKEQQQQIEAAKKENEELKKRLAAIEKVLKLTK